MAVRSEDPKKSLRCLVDEAPGQINEQVLTDHARFTVMNWLTCMQKQSLRWSAFSLALIPCLTISIKKE